MQKNNNLFLIKEILKPILNYIGTCSALFLTLPTTKKYTVATNISVLQVRIMYIGIYICV